MALANTFKKVLSKLGEPVTITRSVSDSFNDDTGEFTQGSELTFDGFAAQEQYTTSEIDGTTILRGDVKVVISKLSERPKVGDRLTMDNVTYSILNVYPPRMSGKDVVYIAQGRA